MSRIGKTPISIPQGVKIACAGSLVNVEGPKGKLQSKIGAGISVKIDGSTAHIMCSGTDRQSSANYGTARAVINNMVLGVTKGWKRALEMNGVGFGAKVQGPKIVLSVGFSHEVAIDIPKEVKATVDKTKIVLESADRQLVGQIAAKIRKVQPPEPYLGKGIKYEEEVIRRKAGKTAKK